MSMRFAGVVVAAGLLLGCDTKPEAPAQPQSSAPAQVAAPVQEPAVESEVVIEAAADPKLIAHGKELVAKYECSRCHTIAGIEPPELDMNCAGCHQEILAGTFEATEEELTHWQGRLHSLDDVPSLTATDRFSRDWIASFLPRAYSLRPALLASMPRFEMSSQDAQAIAAFLVPSAQEAVPELGDAANGAVLLESKGCGSCHRMEGAKTLAVRPTPKPIEAAAFAKGQKMAPDLSHARLRLRPAAMVSWIVEPTKMKADAAMPELGITRDEALDIAAYLIQTPLADEAPPMPPEFLPVLEREVTYAEVNERIFGKICRHCHSNPTVVIGDGGPGYSGGFGFPVRELDLSTYEGLRSGSLSDDGKRRSVFKPIHEGGPARLVEHLRARHFEVLGLEVEGVRGMPLGLPPMPLEDIALLETWIAQGRKKGT